MKYDHHRRAQQRCRRPRPVAGRRVGHGPAERDLYTMVILNYVDISAPPSGCSIWTTLCGGWFTASCTRTRPGLPSDGQYEIRTHGLTLTTDSYDYQTVTVDNTYYDQRAHRGGPQRHDRPDGLCRGDLRGGFNSCLPVQPCRRQALETPVGPSLPRRTRATSTRWPPQRTGRATTSADAAQLHDLGRVRRTIDNTPGEHHQSRGTCRRQDAERGTVAASSARGVTSVRVEARPCWNRAFSGPLHRHDAAPLLYSCQWNATALQAGTYELRAVLPVTVTEFWWLIVVLPVDGLAIVRVPGLWSTPTVRVAETTSPPEVWDSTARTS